MIYSFKMFHQKQQGTNITPCMSDFTQCELCVGHYIRGKSAKAISKLPEHLQCQCIVRNPTGTIFCNGCGTPTVQEGIRRGYHPDDYTPCIPEQGFRNERSRHDDGLSMVCQKKIQTRDIGTQCNVCCGSFEQEESGLVSSSVTLFNDCVSSSDNPNPLTEISFFPTCDRVDGLNDSGCYSLDQFIVLPSRSLPNDEIPCRECGEVMVPNPENSDAVDRGYCENCWGRR